MQPRFAALLCFLLVVGATQLSNAAEADRTAEVEEWENLQKRKKALSAMRPEILEGEHFANFLAEYSQRAGELADAFKAFSDRNPDNREGREAWRQWMNYLDTAAQGNAERRKELERAEESLLADPKLSRAKRESIRYNQVDRIRDLGERERFARSIRAEFSADSNFLPMQLLTIAEFTDAAHAQELVKEVLALTESVPEHTRQHAEALVLQKKLERLGKPLDLEFTALDGTAINIKDYAGKVVLIDFWATWCAPCIAGLPKLKEIWQKHRAEGFEVICISYDTDRGALEKFIRKNSLPWPQFFSPDGTEAPLVAEFGKPGPPAYWLVDHNGMLVDVSSRNDPEGKIKDLLAKRGEQVRKRGSDSN